MTILLQRMETGSARAPAFLCKPQAMDVSALSRLDLCTFFRCTATIGTLLSLRRAHFHVLLQIIDFKHIAKGAANLGKLSKAQCGRLSGWRNGSCQQSYTQDLWKASKGAPNPQLSGDFDVLL